MTTAEARRKNLDATLEPRAAKLFSRLANPHTTELTVFHELHGAWHDGWDCGFRERKEIDDEFGPDWPKLLGFYFIAGVGVGFAVAMVLR